MALDVKEGCFGVLPRRDAGVEVEVPRARRVAPLSLHGPYDGPIGAEETS